jgi:ADP-ribosylglycohydrolase
VAGGLGCALASGGDFSKAVWAALHFSGKNDAIGAIAGSISGACHSAEGLCDAWLTKLEMRDLIEEVAGDLYDQFKDQKG